MTEFHILELVALWSIILLVTPMAIGLWSALVMIVVDAIKNIFK